MTSLSQSKIATYTSPLRLLLTILPYFSRFFWRLSARKWRTSTPWCGSKVCLMHLGVFQIFLKSPKNKPAQFTRWWFQIFFIFTPTWGRFPFWLIFFKGVETTNQFTNFLFVVSLFIFLNLFSDHLAIPILRAHLFLKTPVEGFQIHPPLQKPPQMGFIYFSKEFGIYGIPSISSTHGAGHSSHTSKPWLSSPLHGIHQEILPGAAASST